MGNGRGHQVGFSGTNDLDFLLPGNLKQTIPEEQELRATNGKMVAHLMKAKFHPLVSNNTTSSPTANAHAVIKFAVESSLSALIDVGALMAGLSNGEVADAILETIRGSQGPAAYRGVVYFDVDDRKWTVRSLLGQSWHLSNSPIPAQDTFAYYDESRCRGADLKLKKDAVGLLTLSPALCKDALMQAAGRLRGLDWGQRVEICAPADVCSLIRDLIPTTSSTPIEPAHVIAFVMANTEKSGADGLVQWSAHGVHWLRSQQLAAEGKALCEQELVELSVLYNDPEQDTTVYDAVLQRLEKLSPAATTAITTTPASTTIQLRQL
eukprot:TRINITY_DN2010_c0_g1_i1.p3 TRINITY_DN2010_c0_g1~~TRINITY_DN2010_c0_g1_i1.p3  ORF type:complete len:323 (+),score=73.82 TRINITY_DN2010_c0_g1_i1:2247-3215(+)